MKYSYTVKKNICGNRLSKQSCVEQAVPILIGSYA